MSKDGGSLIPDAMMKELHDSFIDRLRNLDAFYGPPPPPLTHRQRIRYWLWSRQDAVRWWFHDRLFPDCPKGDGW